MSCINFSICRGIAFIFFYLNNLFTHCSNKINRLSNLNNNYNNTIHLLQLSYFIHLRVFLSVLLYRVTHTIYDIYIYLICRKFKLE